MSLQTTPALLSFDIFGTVIDWHRGMREALASLQRTLDLKQFEEVIDFQGAEEGRSPFRNYREIAAVSFTEILGLESVTADRIAGEMGHWPLFQDSAPAIRQLIRLAPCVAMTNSDRVHARQVQDQLGFQLSEWVCAEDLRTYKPSAEFWLQTANRLGIQPNRSWWHVSAYSDYDLEVARSLGLTCILVRRPHHRSGVADGTVSDLLSLASQVASR